MAVSTFTDDIDLSGSGGRGMNKRVASVNLVAAGVASTVNIRRGALTGAIVQSFPLAINERFVFAWPAPIWISEGVFVECTAAIAFGAIDVI